MVKKESVPLLPKTPPATIVSSSISAVSLVQATKPVSAPSTPSQRSTKELVAFLLKDDRTDEKAKELLKKVVAKQLTKLHTTKPGTVAQSVKPIVPVTVGVVQSVNKPRVAISNSSSVVAQPAVKSVDPKSSQPKTTRVILAGSTTSPITTQSSVVRTESGQLGLATHHVNVSSPPKAEKKKEKRKKVAKDSLSLPATLANAGAVKNLSLKTAASSNPPHMLTSTAGLSTAGLLQYITSVGSAPLIKVITKAAGGSQPAQPTAAAPTAIITTSDGRLLLTGASQPQVTIAQGNFSSGKSIPSQSSKGAKSGGADGGITGLLKKGGSADSSSSKSVVGGALSSSPRQQLKTTPVIHIPRVSPIPARTSASAFTSSTQLASNPNTAVSVAKSTPPPPPPPLATIVSTKGTTLNEEAIFPHPQPGNSVIASSQPLKRLKLETLSATGQQEQDSKHKKASIVANNNQQTVLKTVATTKVPLVQPPQTVVPLTGGKTYARVVSQPDSLSIPALPKLFTSSKQVRRPVVQQLPLAGAMPDTTTNASVTSDVQPLTSKASDSYRVVPETPPLSTAPFKESSPLKSPVEQIMEEHSYLGSSHSGSPPVQPAGHNLWQPQFGHASSPEQLQSEENVLQAKHVPKVPGAYYAKDQ